MSNTSVHRAVSFQGDEHDIAAVNQLAREKGLATGVFVASILREALGDDFEQLASFFRQRASQKSHLPSEQVGEA